MTFVIISRSLLSTPSTDILSVRHLTTEERIMQFETKCVQGGYSAGNGALSKVANFLLVLALVHVDASVQYPMVTGGTMIVSTAISFFCRQKPSKRELLSAEVASAYPVLPVKFFHEERFDGVFSFEETAEPKHHFKVKVAPDGVTVVDIRYISSQLLGNYLSFQNQDVLFAYSTLILNNSSTLK